MRVNGGGVVEGVRPHNRYEWCRHERTGQGEYKGGIQLLASKVQGCPRVQVHTLIK
jgi:hypothetical protein